MFETSDPPATQYVATISPCPQYGYRVELTDEISCEIRDGIYRRAVEEMTETYLECLRNFQDLAWFGVANLAFAHGRLSPQDSQSKFIHELVSLKILELAFAGAKCAKPAVKIESRIPKKFRTYLKSLGPTCDAQVTPLPILTARPEEEQPPETETETETEIEVGAGSGGFEGFEPEWLIKILRIQSRAIRKVKNIPLLNWLTRNVFTVLRLSVRFLLTCRRVIFHFRYRAVFQKVMAHTDGKKKVFLFFESRSGRNREVESYLQWKLSKEFLDNLQDEIAVVPFTHFHRSEANCSRSAMTWAMDSLQRMISDPADACVVANFLIPPWRVFTNRFGRKKRLREVRNRLSQLMQVTNDFLAGRIYQEWRAALHGMDGPTRELGYAYCELFNSSDPGVVVQADALTRGARQFTVCARRANYQVVYVADRICTKLRTSNQLVPSEIGNSHFPDRCVLFDTISRDELARQGFPLEKIHLYHRRFSAGVQPDKPIVPLEPNIVLVMLQAPQDHMEAMLETGAEIARADSSLTVVFQEHPHFPVKPVIRAKLLQEMKHGLHFLQQGKKIHPAEVLVTITGYSTAVIPFVLQGVPLVWMRQQVGNSIFGEDYLTRIGIPSDSTQETIALVRGLRSGRADLLAVTAAARIAAQEIFEPSEKILNRPIAHAVREAVDACFADLAIRESNVSDSP